MTAVARDTKGGIAIGVWTGDDHPETRAKALEAQAAERARQQAAEEARLHTFKPKLATSKQQQRAGKERRHTLGKEANFVLKHKSL